MNLTKSIAPMDGAHVLLIADCAILMQLMGMNCGVPRSAFFGSKGQQNIQKHETNLQHDSNDAEYDSKPIPFIHFHWRVSHAK